MTHPLDGMYATGGFALDVRVSPCSWMYPGYGLQVEYRDGDNRSHGFCNRKDLDQALATREDVQALLDALAPAACAACGRAHLRDGVDDRRLAAYRDLCESCRLAKIQSEYDQELARERDEQEAKDRRMLADGYGWRVSAWIHPPRGDDYQVDVYYAARPSAAAIRAFQKGKKSRVLDDYRVVDLREEGGRG